MEQYWTGGSSTTSANPIPDPVVTDAPHLYNFQLGVTTIVWTVEDQFGKTATCSHTIEVVDVTPPVILELDPLEECVERIAEATYDEATMDITPARPEYYQV